MGATVDISSTIFLFRLLKACRFFAVIAIMGCIVGYLNRMQAVWLWLLFASFAAWVIFKFPHRLPLLTLFRLLLLSSVAVGIWCLYLLISNIVLAPGAQPVFSLLCVAGAFYFLCRGVRWQKSSNPQPASTSTMFTVQPSLTEIRRPQIPVPFLICGLLFFIGFASSSFLDQTGFLILALIVGVMAIYFFLPALADAHSAPLSLAITRNRPRKGRRSYGFFVVRNIIRTPRSLGWVGVAALLLFGTVTVLSLLQNGTIIMLGSSVAFGGVVFCWRRANQYALMTAVKSSHLDSESFTLFLRSFIDEDVEVPGNTLSMTLLSLLFLSHRNAKSMRLEELIARVVWPFGKLVALGRPGEELPQIGALRLKVSPSDDWQATVERLIARATHVLIATGISTGVKWEFGAFDRPENRLKLSLIIPPEDHPEASWKIFAGKHPELLTYSDDELARALAMRFDQRGSPILLLSRQKSAHAYRLALSSCLLPMHQFVEVTGITGESTRVAQAGS